MSVLELENVMQTRIKTTRYHHAGLFVLGRSTKEKEYIYAFVSTHRAETIVDCKVRISLVCNNGKLAIHEFVEEHNHSL